LAAIQFCVKEFLHKTRQISVTLYFKDDPLGLGQLIGTKGNGLTDDARLIGKRRHRLLLTSAFITSLQHDKR